MKVGIVYDDRFASETDMRFPERGNPGVGGTQYCVGMLIRYLSMKQDSELTVYQFGNTLLPEGVKKEKVGSLEQCFEMGERTQLDVLIVTHALLPQSCLAQIATSLKLIVWVHNYLSYEQTELFSRCPAVKRVVFVSRQLYDIYLDHAICKKADYIFNMYQNPSEKGFRGAEYGPVVTYLGNIAFVKGFHILARQWSRILKQVPEAQLYVIGNGKLYDKQEKLGSYGIAEEKYEKEFVKYLIDEKGNFLPSVHFCGLMGQEKYEIFEKTAVGVMPSIEPETFGLSAVEMEAYGIPVVVRGKRGLLDISSDKKTGYQFRNDRELARAVVKLLKNRQLNRKLGNGAKKLVEDKFAPSAITAQWCEVINDVSKGMPAKYHKPENYFLRQLKFVKIFNRQLRKLFPSWPSVMEWHHKMKS